MPRRSSRIPEVEKFLLVGPAGLQTLVLSVQVQTTTSIVWTSAHDFPCWSLMSTLTLYSPRHKFAWSLRMTVVSRGRRR